MPDKTDAASNACDTEKLLQQGIARHQAGNLNEAEDFYRAILKHHPRHPDANHNLGVIALQVGRPDASIPHFRLALESNPSYAQYWISYGDALVQAGHLDEARQLLLHEGLQTDVFQRLEEVVVTALLLSGNRLFGIGNLEGSEACFRKALEIRSDIPELYYNLGWVLKCLKKPEEPELCYRKALEIKPDYAEAHYNLGTLLYEQGRRGEAAICYRRAVEIKPDHVEGHHNMGIVLHELGKTEEAEASYRCALNIQPDYYYSLINLGNVLKDTGRLQDSASCYRKALEIKPDYAEAYYNMGLTLQILGRPAEAEASYRKALETSPDYIDALNNLAMSLYGSGRVYDALQIILRSLRIKETGTAKLLFVDCIKNLRLMRDDGTISGVLVRALTEPWGRPKDLAPTALHILRLDPDIDSYIKSANSSWPSPLSAQELFGRSGLEKLAADPLLTAMLYSAPVSDMEMERFLALSRAILLGIAYEAAERSDCSRGLEFFSALAFQCFVNEYVFPCSPEEVQHAVELRDALGRILEAGSSASAFQVLAVAAYFPLSSVPNAAGLLAFKWPDGVNNVLLQQVREPAEELELCATIPCLTEIGDETSLMVQQQYEENPYPRWVKTDRCSDKVDLYRYLKNRFPMSSFNCQEIHKKGIEILVAGSGTGQHPISTALLFRNAGLLAIDLSRRSLGYAKRKSIEMGLDSIEYAQADILKLERLGRHFDLIESVGVLHHLADPWEGWRNLLDLLRPGGFMKLGFYSELARKNIVILRNLIIDNGYGSTPDEIRRCRQYLTDLNGNAEFDSILKSPDFFSTSACRDLLFHVREHRMSLPEINRFLMENNLTFLGFDIDARALESYRQQFPEDPAATSLERWHVFETEKPETFLGMYQFWIQKNG